MAAEGGGVCGSDDSEHAVSVQGHAYMQQIGWQNTWEQAPGVPATRGALDNEELFVIECSKTDPWRSTPENWRSAKNAAFHGENPIPDVIRAARIDLGNWVHHHVEKSNSSKSLRGLDA